MMAKFLPEAQKAFVESYPDTMFIKSAEFKPEELTKAADSYKEQGIITETLDLSKLLYNYTP